MDFFKVEKLTTATTVITDITGVRCFLVQGEREAFLIDTCAGAGNLKECVDSLTTLPVTVILTHGHCDHAGSAVYFEKAYLPRRSLY